MIPGLEVAAELRRRGHECVFVGTAKGIETRLVPRAGFALELLAIGAFNRVSIARKLKTLLLAPRALAQASALLARRRPAAVLSLGGYASGPLAAAALARRVPLVALEPNAYPGLANRLAGRFAARALLGFEEASRWFPADRVETIGTPIRAAFFNLAPKQRRGPASVLVTGGSQGSRTLNRAAMEAARLWMKKPAPGGLKVLHQTGASEYNSVQSCFKSLSRADSEIVLQATPFIDDMGSAFAEADLVVCRAGASALAELAAAGKAAILVPFPHAADQHQLRNAEAVVAAGAARLVVDAEWTGERMVAETEAILGDGAELERMQQASRGLARPEAARIAADRLEEVARRS